MLRKNLPRLTYRVNLMIVLLIDENYAIFDGFRHILTLPIATGMSQYV